MPFYVLEIGCLGTGCNEVRNADEAVSAADPNALIVFRGAVEFASRGLMSPDGLHYNQAGYNEMGRVAAETIAVRIGRQ